MRFVLAMLALLIAAPVAAFAADTVLADPKPGWDNPRRIVLQLTTDDPKRVNGVFHNAINLQKFYGQDNVKVAIVAYGAGVRPLLKQDSPVAERVASLAQYEVEFVACGNTLATMDKKESDLLPGVTVVTAGIAEIVERQIKGWHVVVP
ncbi:MAG TPA: DsrE family protein [Candidatus Omnitrophota bacterium]|nr:DsrE family protein [Candidatus Omnitrophota bacterium]